MVINGNLQFHTLGSGELQNAIMERLTTTARNAASHSVGRLVYDTDLDVYFWSDGSAWQQIGNNTAITNLQTEVDNIEAALGTELINTDGTLNTTGTTVNTLGNVTGATDLYDVLQQLDSAITTASGVDTLEELTDTTATVTSGAVLGDLLFFDGTSYDNTGFTAEPTDNYLLQWNATSNVWEAVDPLSIGDFAYKTITTDVGTSIVADAIGDTMSLKGGTNGGIQTTANLDDITLDIVGADLATGSATLALADFIIVNDSADGATTVSKKYTFTNMVQDLDIAHSITSNGMVARDADNSFVSRTITASAVAGDQGISVVDGDGVNGNPTIGLDIIGLSAAGAAPVSTDVLAVYDGTNNERVTIAQLTDAIVADGITLGELSDVDDGAAHTLDAPVILLGDGTNFDTVSLVPGTNISGTASTATSYTLDVDDVFLSNTGDTLDSGTLTIASGAAINAATGGSISMVDAPTAGTHVTNKNYVDGLVGGLTWKNSVVASTTANVTVAGDVQTNGDNTYALDGITITDGDRILVQNQTAPAENGIYTVSLAIDTPSATNVTATYTRASDMDSLTPIDEVNGAAVYVEQGTTYGDAGFTVTSQVSTLGTDAVTWTQFNGASGITAGTGLSKTGNTLDINMGAGIIELPGDEVGIDLYATNNPLLLSTDGSTPSTVTGAQLSVRYDNSTIGVNGSTQLYVPAQGITETELHTSVAGLGLAGGNGTALSLAPSELTNTATAAGDLIVLADVDNSEAPIKRDITSFISDHNILTGGSGGALTASDGVLISGNDIQLDINNLANTTTMVGADEIVFHDASAAGTHLARTMTDVLADFDIVNTLGGTGIAVQTAADTYTARTITAATTGLEGIDIVNGDGVSGDPTIGLDIVGLTAEAAPATTDVMVLHDGTNNKKVTIANLADTIGAATSLSELSDVNASVDGATDTAGDILVATGSDYAEKTIQFIYTSTTTGAATTHTVTHNLGQQFVNVTVVDSSNEVIIPESITFTSANVVTVTFNTAINCKVVVMGIPGVALTAG